LPFKFNLQRYTAGGGGSTVAGPSTRAALLSVGGAYSCSECS
jgi:hypothetical protein